MFFIYLLRFLLTEALQLITILTSLVSGNNINYENTTGQTLRLLYRGKELLTLKRPRADFPIVTFYELGMKDPNTVRGYIAIEISICKPGLTSGGHAFLKVTKTVNPGIVTYPPLIIK